MNNHDCLLIFNNRGQVSVSALEDFQFCSALSSIYHRMSVVSYKVGKKSAAEALNLMVKKRQRRKQREKLFIIMTPFFFCFVLQQPYFRISSSQVAVCSLIGVF